MKRALGLILITAACIVAFLSIRGTMPFMPIFGSSMEPKLQSGSLLMIEPMDAQDVKVGDIIIYNVSPMIREYYNYPPVIAHRVIEVKTFPGLGFRTAGDNTGEDPFTIRPQDLRGTVGDQIPYLGLPLLFFQSQQGLIFVIVALILLTFFLYGGAISHGGNILHRGIFAPVINEEKRASRIITRKIDVAEQRMNSTEQALEKFSAAIELYARHLNSHTGAIQGLSEASHELKRSSAEQNQVLMRLMETARRPETRKEEIVPRVESAVSKAEKTVIEIEKMAIARVKASHELQKLMRANEKSVLEAQKPVPGLIKPAPRQVKSAELILHGGKLALEAGRQQFPPGCARSRCTVTRW